MVSLTISPASKGSLLKSPLTIDVSADATVLEVKEQIAVKYPKFGVSRQKLSLKGDKKALKDEEKVDSLSGRDLQVKDLGPQMSWRTVFMIEYVGPLIIHPIFYFFPKLIYGKDVEHSALQNYVFAFVMLHFLKRELETVFVHRFSHGTMPFLFVFRNSAYYHICYGLLFAIDIYRPKYSATSPYIVGTYRDNEMVLWIATGFWLYAQVSNFRTHITLRNLRPPGTRVRGLPRGYGFNLVSCPNYFFEIVAWTVLVVLTQSIASYFFIILAIVTLSGWALKRHNNYKKEFGKEYPRHRRALFPFVF
ncbi:hypothetical protein FA15DRAFT_585617 [Coprinopsis marcescibilis]|uniref:very-long-chain enoyl-CoA reductase n=1 Tax=Coprinopsis marcescibilis TaxID=230819 RepID=A0A5C3L6U3_COPMA|nr:hypothetical protein FA15DRAFT_585617 [Coprinopsis marcescibilis]